MLRTFKSRVVRRTFWLIKVVPTWKKFEKHCVRRLVDPRAIVRPKRLRKQNATERDVTFVCKKNWFAWLLNQSMYLMDETSPNYLITSCNTPNTTDSLSSFSHYDTKLLKTFRLNHLSGQLTLLSIFSDCNTHCFDTAISCVGHHVTAYYGMDPGMRWSHGTVRERAPTAPHHRVAEVSTTYVCQHTLHIVLQ
jgi:hypothetical protein